MRADMHIHTLASDGLFTPSDVVAEAQRAGLGAFAVTDHDAVAALKETAILAKAAGLRHITGVEISAYVGDVKIHTLGYGIDYLDGGFNAFLGELREGSFVRLGEILYRLKKCGILLTEEDCAAERLSDAVPVHVMHVCRAAVKKGYAADVNEFFFNYVAYGKPAFSNAARPTPEEAIDAITSAGGIPVMAHPGRIDLPADELKALITRLAGRGLRGIEAVYSAHTPEETAYFKELAASLGLLVTGGSDTHFAGGWRKIGSPAFEPSERLRQILGI